MNNNKEKYYHIAFKDEYGNGFSSFEPWIAECSDDIDECKADANKLIEDGNRDVTIFMISDLDKGNMESITWEYVNKHKVLVK